MAFRFLALAGLALASVGAAAATISTPAYHVVTTLPLKAAFSTTGEWRAIASQVTTRDKPADIPARICFAAPDQTECTLITSRAENGAVALHYSQVKSLRIAAIAPRTKAVVFDALFPHDLGMSIQTSLWTYDRENDQFVPALTFALTEIGKYRIFATGPLAGHVMTAEFVLGENEDRYGGHRFAITAYRLTGHRYVQVLSYVTPDRFKGETEESDDLIEEDVFAHEMPRIRALLKQVYPETKPRIPPPQ